MQFHNAIITAENDAVAKDAFRLCLLLNVGVSFLLALVVFVFGHSIASVYNDEQIVKWLPFAPLSSFLLGANLILSAWALRKKKFKLLSYNRIFSAVLAPAFSILIGMMILGPAGLFVGLLVSQLIPVIRMGYQLLKTDKISLYTNMDSLKSIVRKFRNYPIYSLPSEFINNLSNQFPVMMLTQTGGIQVVGWYNLSVRMLGLPATLISASIGEVFRQRASEDYFTRGTCRPVFVKVFKTLSLSAILPLLILILFGPYLFAFFFGKRWEDAGVITQVLAILYAFKFVASPLSYVTYIANKQWVGLLVDISLLSIVLIIYY
jgi:O-antigen/teichoic acid export membrane protein